MLRKGEFVLDDYQNADNMEPSTRRRSFVMSDELRPTYGEEVFDGTLHVRHAYPVIYRFLEEKYVDEFLGTGRLLISTIRHCRRLEDARRMDENETTYSYELSWADKTEILDARVAENAFVLCCSLTQAAIHGRTQTCCLELHHWNELALEVGEQLRLKGFDIREIFAGPCNYAVKRRQIDMAPMKSKEIRMVDGIVDSQKVNSLLAGIGHELLYTTKDFQYLNEHEYRILWMANGHASDEPVIVEIKSPERYGCKVCAL